MGTTESALTIRRRLDEAARDLDVQELADDIARGLLHGTMLGALDSVWEREEGEPVPLESFTGWRADVLHDRGLAKPFSRLTYDEALRQFQQRQVLTPEAFDALQAGLMPQAFAIAGLAQTELVEEAHDALERMLRDSPSPHGGPNLRDFQAFARDHLESAGWTPANPSHVETVYRTNIASAYSTGRFVEMRQPEVLRARPYWQIFSVRDSRARPAHAAAHGTILPADDPFWAVAYPPFGYNCRCRVVSRSQRWVDTNGASVGARPAGLPDPGFDSGTTALPGATEAVSESDAQQPAQASPPAPPPPPGPVVGPAPPELPATPRPSPPVPPAAGGQAPPQPPLPPSPPTGDEDPSRFTEEHYEAAGVEIHGPPQRLWRVMDQVLGTRDPQVARRVLGIDAAAPGATVQITTHGDRLSIVAETTELLIDRSIGKEGGKLVAYNERFSVDATGKGTGRKILAGQLAEYRRLGVDRVDLVAVDVGQYVWPRMGYALRDPAAMADIRRQYKVWLRDYANLSEELADAPADLHEIALQTVGERKVGKEFLLFNGRNSRGVRLTLDINGEAGRIADEYVSQVDKMTMTSKPNPRLVDVAETLVDYEPPVRRALVCDEHGNVLSRPPRLTPPAPKDDEAGS